MLEMIPDWFPTNTSSALGDPLVEWEWQFGVSLEKVSTKCVYKGLNYRDKWHLELNARWKRE
eukprot:c40094_g1_i1 orf=104-289(+)